MNVCCVIVSHGHQKSAKLILEQLASASISKIVLVENLVKEKWELDDKNASVLFMHNSLQLGFSENNNRAVKLALASDPLIDYLIFINPDVEIVRRHFDNFLNKISEDKPNWCSLTLQHRNGGYDQNIRPFPNPLQQLLRFLFKGHTLMYQNYDKSRLWVSGAFLAISKKAWLDIGGFDVGYKMYFEDVDICWKLQQIVGPPVIYDGVHMIHEGARANRNIFSKNFYWFLMSMLRFYRKYYGRMFSRYFRPRSSFTNETH